MFSLTSQVFENMKNMTKGGAGELPIGESVTTIMPCRSGFFGDLREKLKFLHGVKYSETDSLNSAVADPARGSRKGQIIKRFLKRETVMQFINKLLKNSKGATAIEYGLIAALISVGGIAAMKTIGTAVTTKYGTVNTAVS